MKHPFCCNRIIKQREQLLLRMEKIIEKVDREAIKRELTPECLLRESNKGGNLIYIVDAHHQPQTMREIGRLRELAFRGGGGGTGLSCDIDEFDTMPVPCKQLIVWDPNDSEIIGGYRFILGEEIEHLADGSPRIATSHIFNFSKNFLDNYLPKTIELGRSFVAPYYQSTRTKPKAIYALDNLWDGLGALTVIFPQIEYLFGKVTMYPDYSRVCRDLLLYFMTIHFPDADNLVTPITPVLLEADPLWLRSIIKGESYKDDYKALNAEIRKHGLNIPPLFNAYMSLSPTMRMFGTAVNSEFGNVEESGIFFKISEIFEEKKKRHIDTYHG